MNAGAQVSFLEKGSSRFWSLIAGIFLHIGRIEKQGPDSRTSMMTAPRCNKQTNQLIRMAIQHWYSTPGWESRRVKLLLPGPKYKFRQAYPGGQGE